jgi:tRNA(fMet)-specific endonuclease VapC
MRIFRRSKIFRQSRWINNDAISARQHVCTSIIVAAELRFGATGKNSSRLTAQLEAVLGAIDVLALEAPVDAVYGVIRASLERTGQPIGANDLLIAAHALTLGRAVVTDNEREFLRIVDLRVEKLAKVTMIVQPRH